VTPRRASEKTADNTDGACVFYLNVNDNIGVKIFNLVLTEPDRRCVHNHIYYNSTTLDCTHKFRDFIGSARAVRRLSDRICLENNLSVVHNPKRKSKGQFKHYGEWLGNDPEFRS